MASLFPLRLASVLVLVLVGVLPGSPGCSAPSHRSVLPGDAAVDVTAPLWAGGSGNGPGATALALELPSYSRHGAVTVRCDLPEGVNGGDVELWSTSDGGHTWTLVASGVDGRGRANFEATDGTYGLVAVLPGDGRSGGEDSVGGTESVIPAEVTIDGVSPVARIVATSVLPHFPGRRGGSRVRVTVETDDAGGSGVDRLTLYLSGADGRDVRVLGRFEPGGDVEVDMGSRRGLVGFSAAARDRAGNEGNRPAEGQEPEALVALDSPPFEVRFGSRPEGTVLRGGESRYLDLRVFPGEAREAVASISVDYRVDESGPWMPVETGLAFTDRYLWRVPPVTAAQVFLRVGYRDRHGASRQAIAPWSVAVDSTPPMAHITRARDLGGGRVLVEFSGEIDRPAGVSKLWVYRTGDEAWVSLGSTDGRQQSRLFDLPAGRIGLVVIAEDRAGNRRPAPSPGGTPDVWVDVGKRTHGHLLLLKNFHGGRYQGGQRRYVFWEYMGMQESLAEHPVSIDFSRDDGRTWEPVVAGLDVTAGKIAWRLPALDGQRVRLRVRAALRDGGVLEALSEEPFLIESRPPHVTLEGPETSRTIPTLIAFTASTAPPDDAVDGKGSPAGVSLEKVVCYAAREPGGEWILKGTWEPDESVDEVSTAFPLEFASGRHRIALVAWDSVGNRSRVADGGGEGMGWLLVDTAAPYLRVLVKETKDLYMAGEKVLIDIDADDPNLGRFPVVISLIEGGGAGLQTSPGRKERIIEPFFSARGKHLLVVPVAPGDRELQVVVADLAGNRSVFRHPFRVVPRKPQVRLIGLSESLAILGGTKFEIRWETRFVAPGTAAVTLDFSRDGGATWAALVENHPNTGHWTWNVPREDFRGGRLRISVRCEAGQSAMSLSAPLTVSSTVPRIVIEKIEGVVEE